MKNFSHRSFYVAFVTLWLLFESIYLFELNYSGIFRGWNNYVLQSKLIEELIIQNFLFGLGGFILSILMPEKQICTYLILTYSIGLTIATGTLYLDILVNPSPGGSWSAQSHIASIFAHFGWIALGGVVVLRWILIEIIKYLVELVNRERDDE